MNILQRDTPEISLLEMFDLATQPRFLLPTLFPFVVYLGWLRESTGPLVPHLVAAVAIGLAGWLGAMFVEYQPFVPLEKDLMNEIQGGLLFVVAAVIYVVWNAYGWPTLVQGWALVGAVAVVLWLPARRVLHLSGGVIFPTAVFVYLTLLDVVFAPLLVIPALRIPVGLKIDGLSAFECGVGISLGAVSVVAVALVVPVA